MNTAYIAAGCVSLLGCAAQRTVPRTAPPMPPPVLAGPAPGVFDVRAAPYSARGDGIGDDGDSIQRAIRAAITWSRQGERRALVRLPSGTYRLKRRLELADDAGQPASGLVIAGDGPTSFLAFDHDLADGHGDAVFGRGVRDVVIRDLRLSGTPGGRGFNRGIVLSGGSNVVLRDLEVSGAWLGSLEGKAFGYPSGIFLDGGIADVRILDNDLHDNGTDDGNSWHIVIYGTGGASHVLIQGNRCVSRPEESHRANFGIGVYDSSYVTVASNQVEGIVGTSRDADGYGIMLYGQTKGSSHHHIVSGNTVRHTGGAGIYVQNSPYTVVNGNLLEDTAHTQSSTSLPIGAIGFDLGPGSINGNVIRGVGVGSTALVPPFGIVVQTCSAKAGCAFDDGTPRGIAVSGNTIEETLGYGIAIEAGPSMAGDNSTIIGNTLVNTGGGIGTVGDSPVTGLVVVGNSIVGARRPGASAAPGISLASASTSIVANNAIVAPTGQGVVLSGKAFRNVVAGNVVRDWGRLEPGAYPSLQVSGEGNLITGNQAYAADVHLPWAVVESGTANDLLLNNLAPGKVVMKGTHPGRALNRSAGDGTTEDPAAQARSR